MSWGMTWTLSETLRRCSHFPLLLWKMNHQMRNNCDTFIPNDDGWFNFGYYWWQARWIPRQNHLKSPIIKEEFAWLLNINIFCTQRAQTVFSNCEARNASPQCILIFVCAWSMLVFEQYICKYAFGQVTFCRSRKLPVKDSSQSER